MGNNILYLLAKTMPVYFVVFAVIRIDYALPRASEPCTKGRAQHGLPGGRDHNSRLVMLSATGR
jgi:hypothetical protein